VSRLYFSGPLFSAAEKKFNLDLCQKIEKLGHSVYLPQRDGPEHDLKLIADLNKEGRHESIFVVDRMKVLECDVFLLILDMIQRAMDKIFDALATDSAYTRKNPALAVQTHPGTPPLPAPLPHGLPPPSSA